MGTLNERLEFLLNVNADGAIKGFKATGASAEKELGKVESGIGQTGATMSKVGAGMVVAAGLVGVGLFELSKHWEEAALSAGQMSDATGLSVEAASRWSVVVRGSDVDTAAFEKSIGIMNKTAGRSPATFDKLGISLKDANGQALSTNDLFLSVVDAMNATDSVARKTAIGSQLLGRGWQQMAELVGAGSDELRVKLAAVASAQVFDAKQVADAKQYRDAIKDVGNSFQALALGIGKSAAPVFADFASGIAGVVKGLAAADQASGGFIGKLASIGAIGVGAAGAMAVIAGQAIKMRDKLAPVGEDGTRSLSGIGGAAVAAGVLVAGFSAVTEILGMQAAHTKENIDDLSRRMTSLGLTAEEAAKQKVAAFVASNGDLSAAMEKAGLSVGDLQNAMVAGGPAMDAFKSKVTTAADSLRNAKIASGEFVVQSVSGLTPIMRVTNELDSQSDAYRSVVKTATDTAAATASLGETEKQIAASIAAGVAAQTAANNALVASEHGVAQAYKDTQKAEQDLIGYERGLIDAKYASEEANQRAKAAVDALDKVLKDHKHTTDDATNAVDSARDAAVKASEAYATMNGATLTSKDGIDRQVQSLYYQALALNPSSPLRAAIVGYIGDLQKIPTTVNTTVTTTYLDIGTPQTHHDSFTPGTSTTKTPTSSTTTTTTTGGGYGTQRNARLRTQGVQSLTGDAGSAPATDTTPATPADEVAAPAAAPAADPSATPAAPAADPSALLTSGQAGVWIAPAAAAATSAVQLSADQQNKIQDTLMQREYERGVITLKQYTEYLTARQAAAVKFSDDEQNIYVTLENLKQATAGLSADAQNKIQDTLMQREYERGVITFAQYDAYLKQRDAALTQYSDDEQAIYAQMSTVETQHQADLAASATAAQASTDAQNKAQDDLMAREYARHAISYADYVAYLKKRQDSLVIYSDAEEAIWAALNATINQHNNDTAAAQAAQDAANKAAQDAAQAAVTQAFNQAAADKALADAAKAQQYAMDQMAYVAAEVNQPKPTETQAVLDQYTQQAADATLAGARARAADNGLKDGTTEYATYVREQVNQYLAQQPNLSDKFKQDLISDLVALPNFTAPINLSTTFVLDGQALATFSQVVTQEQQRQARAAK